MVTFLVRKLNNWKIYKKAVYNLRNVINDAQFLVSDYETNEFYYPIKLL